MHFTTDHYCIETRFPLRQLSSAALRANDQTSEIVTTVNREKLTDAVFLVLCRYPHDYDLFIKHHVGTETKHRNPVVGNAFYGLAITAVESLFRLQEANYSA